MIGVDRKITVMLNTVREMQGDTDPLTALAEQLRDQDFSPQDFELVVVDGLFPFRPGILGEQPFRTVHLGPKQTAAVRDRRCAISAYKNTGLAHARGEVIVTVDDCGVLSPGYLRRTWEAWSLRAECLSGLQRGLNSQNLNDSRAKLLQGDSYVGPMPMYGFAAFPLEAALQVNGYDEAFDGSQGLEDIDMGHRLQQAGYRLSLRREHTFALVPQCGWSVRVFGSPEDTLVKCCNHTWEIQRSRNRVRANEQVWTDGDWALIAPCCYLLDGARCRYNNLTCGYRGLLADREHPGLKSVREGQSVFDLAQVRKETLGL